MEFKKDYSEIKKTIIETRRKIHQYPELAFEEVMTAQTICAVLDNYGISYEKNIAKTGIVATIGTGEEKVLLIRADMDALPIEEKSGLDFSSKKPNIMHACGHDIHISAVLACALILKKYEKQLGGTVKIIFQPAEESTGGASPMIDEGILENPKVTCAIGGHVSGEFEVGVIRTKPGALMSSPDDFSVKFIGKSTHGAEPQNGISPIIPACEFVGISKEIEKELRQNSPDVLSICSVISDGSVNIIPDEALVLGTFRTIDSANRKRAQKLIGEYAKKISDKHSCRLEYEYHELYAPLINDEATTELLCDVASTVIGAENVVIMEKHLMTGEDFSEFGKYVPSVFFWYGGMTEKPIPLHSSELVINEDSIETAANIFCEFAIKYLGEK